MKRVIAVLLMFLMLYGFTVSTVNATSGFSFGDLIEKVKVVAEGMGFTIPNFYKNLSNENKATLEGAAVGTGLGALAGQLVGKDTESTVKGAAIGAVIGGVTANAYQKKLETEKKELEKKENEIDARIEYTKKINSDAKKYNEELKKELEKTRRDADALREKQKKNNISKEELGSERAKLVGRLKTAQETKNLLAKELEDLRRFRKDKQGVEAEKLDVQIAELSETLEKVQKTTLEYASVSV